MSAETLYLSPSKLSDWSRCRWSFLLKHVYKWKEKADGAALVFGGAIDDAVDAHLRSLIAGPEINPVDVFVNSFMLAADSRPISYGAKWSEESMLKMGTRMMQLWPEAWAATGLSVAIDRTGEPLMQRDIELALPGNVRFRTKLDLICLTRDGEFAIVDLKTAAQPYPEVMLPLNEQLTAYQIAVDAVATDLGIEKPEKVGFIELIKRAVPKRGGTGEGPTVEPPVLVNRRSEAQVNAYLQKVLWAADDIRAQRFAKDPRMAFESPCSMCAFANACASADYTDVDFSKARYVPQEAVAAYPAVAAPAAA